MPSSSQQLYLGFLLGLACSRPCASHTDLHETSSLSFRKEQAWRLRNYTSSCHLLPVICENIHRIFENTRKEFSIAYSHNSLRDNMDINSTFFPYYPSHFLPFLHSSQSLREVKCFLAHSYNSSINLVILLYCFMMVALNIAVFTT